MLAAVAERVKTPPDDGGLWSGPKVAAWMAEFLGREKVHAQRGWEALALHPKTCVSIVYRRMPARQA
jgi:hypothetical protein